jgi:hypothetical protein
MNFYAQYWSGDQQANINFIGGMVDRLQARGMNFGIYSSASQWNPITGGTTRFGEHPIW